MTDLSLAFLGTFQVIVDGKTLTRFHSSKIQGMLAYLAINSQLAVPRSTLAAFFWPDANDSSAKKNLRQAIYQLRQLLNDDKDKTTPLLLVNRQTVQFNAASDARVDVQMFLHDLEHGDLESAVSHYQGELLTGFTCDSLEFEEWLRLERERLHRLALTALDDLAERQIARANYEAAQLTAQRQLALEPWRETAHRQLMRAFALAGDRSAALAQHALCQQLLEDELGVTPSRETETLAARIRANALGEANANLIAGQYELGAQIGQGAMGTVYLGKDTHSRQPVAIKMLDRNRVVSNPELVERFRREGEALRQLAHPNIVQLLAMDEKEGHHYLVMEFIEGGDLQQYLQKNAQLSLKDVLSIALDIADALTRSHHLHILHRDIKPANILLDSENRPKLTDFGIARLSEDSTLTQHGAMMGTIAYLSPEGCRGEPLDERADIWAFGLLIYEMLAGKRPFAKPTSAATLVAILQEPVPDLGTIRHDLPPAFSNLLMHMLAKDKKDRIASVRAVGNALDAILKSLETGESVAIVTTATTEPNVVAPATSPTTQPLTAGSAPYLAPPAPPHFVGRASLLAELTTLVTSQSVVALVGMGGIGKTSLAAAVGQQLRAQFADGILWASTHSSETSNILELWGRAYGYDFSGLSDIASRETAVRGMLAEKQTLLILDNVGDAADARPLMLAGELGAVLLTTRNQDVAAALNAHPFLVPELQPNDSQSLLVQILGEERVLVNAEESAAAEQIGELLHHLPLAVEIAAQRLKSRPRMRLMAMAKRLQDTQRRLGLEISDQAVRASFQVSWDALDEPLQQLFAQMAVFAGRPFTLDALAATADRDIFDTEDDLYTLTALSLVQDSGETHVRQHLLLADFAAEKLEDATRTQQRMAAYYLTFAQEFKNQFAKLDPEWDNINAAIQMAFELEAWQIVLDFSDALAKSWMRYGRFYDATHAYALAQTAAENRQAEEQLARALLRSAEINIELNNYNQAWQQVERGLHYYYESEIDEGIAKSFYLQGFILNEQGEYQQAEKLLIQSQGLFASLGLKKGEAEATDLLARVYFHTEKSTDKSKKLAEQAISLLSEADADELISTLIFLATIEISNRNLIEAQKYAQDAIQLGEKQNNRAQVGAASRLLIIVYRKQEEYQKAQALAEDTVKLFRQLGNKRYEGMILDELGQIYFQIGQYSHAKEMIQQALDIYRQIEDRLGYGYDLCDLGAIHFALGEKDQAETAWQEAKQISEFLNHAALKSYLQEQLSAAESKITKPN